MKRLPDSGTYGRLRTIASLPLEEINSSGYVVDTLEAAIWALANTKSYEDCVLAAVNMGSDTDTVGAVAGALAGIVYGFDLIPEKWVETLRGKDIIESCLFDPETCMPSAKCSAENAEPVPEQSAPKVALKSSWKILPMPKEHKKLDIFISLSEEELAKLVLGRIPRDMDERWFMYFDGQYVRYYRSWTGTCIYLGEIERVEDVPAITSITVNRDETQYTETDDDYDRE
ncbi:MAG: ADP-ribosylglycohydrolase family protein, partial [Eggerthellaceae bacterium]|nr:ADP-ribosylglycohydrolase family protein [Eggerthellaceae bacterium]